MSREGDVLDEIESADGVSTIAPHAFPATLERLAGGWFLAYPGLPIIASGMIGSRHGWREAPYVRCPAEPRDIAANLTPVGTDEREVHLAPGLAYEDESGQPDVMRGEEVEILGIASAGARLIVLPGSHSKWASRRSGPHSELQDLRHRGALRRSQGSHARRRLRPRGQVEAAGRRLSRGAATAQQPTLGEKNGGPPRLPLRRAQPAADGQARRGRRGRLSVGAPDRGGNRGGAAPLRRRGRRMSPAPRRSCIATSRPSMRSASQPSPFRRAPRRAGSISLRAQRPHPMIPLTLTPTPLIAILGASDPKRPRRSLRSSQKPVLARSRFR